MATVETADDALTALGCREEGNAAFREGRLEDALRWYGDAVQRSAGCPASLCNRSLVLTKLGRYEEAVEDADEALLVLTYPPLDGLPPFKSAKPADSQLLGKAHFRKATALIGLVRQEPALAAIKQAVVHAKSQPAIMKGCLELLQRPEMTSPLSERWAALIEDAQRPAMLSSRDGRLLKPVPFQCSLSSEELADKLTSLPPAFLRKLVACWARDKEPGRAALAAARSWAYLQADDVKQAVKDATCAVAFANGGWAGAEMMLAMAQEEAKDFPQAALAAGRACALDPGREEYVCLRDRIAAQLSQEQREVFAKEGVEGLERWLEDEKERRLPEYLRKRPKYYYYYEYMRKRINALHPALPEPVMDKMLSYDAEELDMVLTYPRAATGQIHELLDVYETHGAERLAAYTPKMLSYEEIKDLEQEAAALTAEPVGYIEKVAAPMLENTAEGDWESGPACHVAVTAPASGGLPGGEAEATAGGEEEQEDNDDVDLDALD
eukprot:jgi/Tetstr1/427655/TSEL_017780.t1